MTTEHARPTIVLATHNPAKLAELRRILAASRVDVDVADLDDHPDMPQVAETGSTFAENALLKARAVAAHTGLPAVADDSGLCADALNGMPGVLSARWSGRHGDDEANLRLLLAQLADVPADRRAAHFACAAALVLPSGAEEVAEGTVHGWLTDAPRGTNGFGYDPIFVPGSASLTTGSLTTGSLTTGSLTTGGLTTGGLTTGGLTTGGLTTGGLTTGGLTTGGLTTAQMPPEEKDAISHRGKALRALAPVIAALLTG